MYDALSFCTSNSRGIQIEYCSGLLQENDMQRLITKPHKLLSNKLQKMSGEKFLLSGQKYPFSGLVEGSRIVSSGDIGTQRLSRKIHRHPRPKNNQKLPYT